MQTYFFKLSVQIQAITISSSSLSAIASLLIISIILRSPSKLSKAYHKIMFSLSFWDTLSSIAIALTTLPMSKDIFGIYVHDWLPDWGVPVYEFRGIFLGNAGTCAAQGFAISLGQTMAILSNVTLSIYYVSTIRFKMTDQTVQKKLLPIMAGVTCLLGLPGCIISLVRGQFNPQPFEVYCSLGPYPYLCNVKDIVDVGFEIPDCIRGDVSPEFEKNSNLWITIVLSLYFIVMVVSLLLVVISVFQTEMAARRMHTLKEEEDTNNEMNACVNLSVNAEPDIAAGAGGDTNTNTPIRQRDIDDYQQTRTVLRIALMYIGAFFLTWVWTFMSVIWTPPLDTNTTTYAWVLQYGHTIFLPSQGFFNVLIFIYNEICFARQAKPALTFSQALKMVVFNPSDMPEVLVSSLDVVHEDRNKKEQEERIQELVDLEREQEEEEVEISELSPVSVPFNFSSNNTPSFALSNAMSSTGIDKELEEMNKRDGDPNDTRQFYADTPKEYLEFSGDTLPAAWNLEQNSPQVPNSRRTTLDPNQTRESPHAEGSNRSDESSRFTSKSLLSGFSRGISHNSHISEEEQDGDGDQRN